MKNMKNNVGKTLFWTPRILSIIFIGFLALFSFDVFGQGYSFWETVVGLFMHNIPVMILAIILWISWKREIVGAIAFILAGLTYVALITFRNFPNGQFEWYMISYSLIIAGPAFLIGVLFLAGWIKKKR